MGSHDQSWSFFRAQKTCFFRSGEERMWDPCAVLT